MNAVRAAVATALAVLLLAGCTGGSEPSSSGSPSAAGSGSTSPSASASPSGPAPTVTPAPAAPALRACYLLTTAQLTQPTSDAPAVPCRRRHTARTIYVGRLDTAVDGHSVAVDSATVQRQLATTCPRKLAAVRRRLGEAARPVPVQRGLVQPHAPAVGPGRRLVPLRPDRLRGHRHPGAAPADPRRRPPGRARAAGVAGHLRPVRDRGPRRAGLPAGDLRAAALVAGHRHDRALRRRPLPRRRDGPQGR